MRFLLLALAACHPLPPPPMVAMHADTAAAPERTTTVMLVVGIAGEIFGGDGWGAALRVERQATERTALGLELTGGLGEEAKRKSEDPVRRSLIAFRTYGRTTPRTHDWIAATYGIGLSRLDTGMITATVHAGTAVSYVNDHAAPVLQIGMAAAFVVARGQPFGDVDSDVGALFTTEHDGHPPPHVRQRSYARSDVFLTIDSGLVGLLAGGSNRLSVDAMFASSLRSGDALLGISIADAARDEP